MNSPQKAQSRETFQVVQKFKTFSTLGVPEYVVSKEAYMVVAGAKMGIKVG